MALPLVPLLTLHLLVGYSVLIISMTALREGIMLGLRLGACMLPLPLLCTCLTWGGTINIDDIGLHGLRVGVIGCIELVALGKIFGKKHRWTAMASALVQA
jgi:hypothetical protein